MTPTPTPLIETPITIQKVLDDRTCHATLPNGKVVFGFIEEGGERFPLVEGAQVLAQLNVEDFSCAQMMRNC